MQLNHPHNQPCLNPIAATNNDFIVIDNHGIHEISLDFCGCEAECDKTIQLLRHRMFPATVSNPKTAATFNCLERYHLECLEGKVTAFEFYHSLVRGTDNTGVTVPKVQLCNTTRFFFND